MASSHQAPPGASRKSGLRAGWKEAESCFAGARPPGPEVRDSSPETTLAARARMRRNQVASIRARRTPGSAQRPYRASVYPTVQKTPRAPGRQNWLLRTAGPADGGGTAGGGPQASAGPPPRPLPAPSPPRSGRGNNARVRPLPPAVKLSKVGGAGARMCAARRAACAARTHRPAPRAPRPPPRPGSARPQPRWAPQVSARPCPSPDLAAAPAPTAPRISTPRAGRGGGRARSPPAPRRARAPAPRAGAVFLPPPSPEKVAILVHCLRPPTPRPRSALPGQAEARAPRPRPLPAPGDRWVARLAPGARPWPRSPARQAWAGVPGRTAYAADPLLASPARSAAEPPLPARAPCARWAREGRSPFSPGAPVASLPPRPALASGPTTLNSSPRLQKNWGHRGRQVLG